MNKIIEILLFPVLIIIFIAVNCNATIYLYKDDNNKLFLTNSIDKTSDKKIVEKSDQYKIIYANNDEIQELKQAEEQIKLLDPAEQSEFLFDKEISVAAAKHGIEFALLKAVIKSLTKFDVNYNNDGRLGIAGIKKNWVAEKKVKDSNTPSGNIEIGAMMLSEYLIKFDYDLFLTLSAYYLSPDKVEEELKNTGDLPKVPECRIFINNVLTNFKTYSDEITENSPTPIKQKFIKEGNSVLLYNEIKQ
ncbi:lytic transglycosylase domain-containing protein [Candidatus Dependentiae bacterium]|nr:lytic transglycosylase domain-containing protein [Candidatus Dependentiae bacterium]